MKIGQQTREKVFVKYKGHCAYCGCEIYLDTFTVDHIVPQCRGGANNIKNYNPCCKRCNQLKSDHSLVTFRNIIKYKISEKHKEIKYLNGFCKFNYKTPEEIKVKFYFERTNLIDKLKKIFKFFICSYRPVCYVKNTEVGNIKVKKTPSEPIALVPDPFDNTNNEFFE